MAKISIIINSWNEPNSIAKAITCIANSEYSGIPDDYEIIQASPDEATLNAGKAAAEELGILDKYKQLKDPKKGKPFALNLAHQQATGEIIIMTDGDVYFGKNCVAELLKPFNDPEVGGVTGRPMSMDSRNNMMGYFGHLLTDAAHHKRSNSLTYFEAEGYYLSERTFFPMSGYIYAVRKFQLEIPATALVEDAYISHLIFNSGKKIAYNANATVYVKFPSTLQDYYKQKVRSLGGNAQLKDLGVVTEGTEARKFTDELAYAGFPLSYAKNIKEFCWSLALFPIRLITWIKIKFYVKNLPKKMEQEGGWQRIETTK
jgi:cellulose synthase/poly-beta-1,6-N-acetylglucosamine synthase-like glycosyltransferase